MMTKHTFKSIATPVIAVMLCVALYVSGHFQIIFAALIMLLASWIEYGKGTFKSLGFRRSNFKPIPLLVVAPLAAGVMFLFYWYVLVQGVTYLTGQPMDYSQLAPYKENLASFLVLLLIVWVSAAFGEEIVFKGYLMRQFSKFFGNSNVSIVLNILIFSTLFGWLHMGQGISGQIITGVGGAIFATIFHLRKNDLWFNIALHGFFDTIALILFYNS